MVPRYHKFVPCDSNWVQRLHGMSSQVDWLNRSVASSPCGPTISQVRSVRFQLGAKTAWNDLTSPLVLTSRLAHTFRGFFFRWLRHDITSRVGAKTAWNVLTSRLANSFRSFFFRGLWHDITSRLGAMPIGCKDCMGRPHKSIGSYVPRLLLPVVAARYQKSIGCKDCME